MAMHPQAREQIRTARMSSGLSLRELGRRTGVTASLLSQIENGKSDPSITTLAALVAALGLSGEGLLRQEHRTGDDESAVPSARVAANPSGDGAEPASPVVRPAERSAERVDPGIVRERLIRGPNDPLDASLVTYQPGACSSSDGGVIWHGGVEYAYLMSGELTLHLGFETHVLRAGDSLQFDARTPHVYWNSGAAPARGLWFVLDREPSREPGRDLPRACGGD